MDDSTLSLDYGYCTPQVLGPKAGLSLAELEGQTARALQWVEELQSQGRLGFMDLPQQGEAELKPILEQAQRLQRLADTLVVLGIGGSALGATAVDMALAGGQRNAFERPGGAMRLFVADNSDPRAFAQLLENLDPSRTAFNVISKSGSTAETMSQFLVVLELLERELGAEQARERLVFTTDPEKGNLRVIAGQEPIACLSVPPNVGGRYSVLSAVGLLPLACAGHDVQGLLRGAAAMAHRCRTAELTSNPAALLAAVAVEYMRRGRNILVMMPYASDLLGLAQWFAQLWAESLGKARDLTGKLVNLGQTPVAAVGATDQHSQLQLYMEGPQDKLVIFMTLQDYGRQMPIPFRYQQIEALNYLGGHSMGELIQAEARSTAAALASQGRPSLSLRLPRLDGEVLGQALYLLEVATVIAGGLMQVDPLDQPGVELSKRLTYGLMGRPGFEQERQRLAKLELGDKYLV